MKNKKILSQFNTLEKVILILNFLFFTTEVIVINSLDGYIAYLSCLTYLIFLLFNTKANFVCFSFCIISYLIYMYFDIKLSYFGEFGSGVIAIVIDFITLIIWKKNSDDDSSVIINKLSKKEILLTTIITLFSSVIIYFVLKIMKSDYIILNTLSLTFVAMTYYFSIRRSAIRFIPNLFASIIYLVLWIIAYNPSSTYAILFATNGAFEIIWVIYGFFSWNKIRKNQEQKLIEKKESKIDTN